MANWCSDVRFRRQSGRTLGYSLAQLFFNYKQGKIAINMVRISSTVSSRTGWFRASGRVAIKSTLLII